MKHTNQVTHKIIKTLKDQNEQITEDDIKTKSQKHTKETSYIDSITSRD